MLQARQQDTIVSKFQGVFVHSIIVMFSVDSVLVLGTKTVVFVPLALRALLRSMIRVLVEEIVEPESSNTTVVQYSYYYPCVVY